MTIGYISMSDFEEIEKVLFSRWPDFFEWFNRGWLKSFLKQRGAPYCLKWLGENQEIIGVILSQPHRSSLYVRAVLVAEDYRRKGIGNALFREIELAARKNNLRTIYLESGERDYATGAFQFYTAIGYEVTGYARIHGEKLIFFEKVLN